MRQVLRKTRFFLCGLMVMGLVAAGSAQAALLFDWSYKNSSFNVGPTDDIILEATLQVLAGSTESLIGSNYFSASFYSAFTPDFILGRYDLSFGSSGNIFNEFSGQTINPGESLMFTFGTLTPKNGVPVAVGNYSSIGANLGFRDISGFEVVSGGVGENVVDVTVSGGSPVPAPSAMLLFGSGLAALAAWRHKRRRMS